MSDNGQELPLNFLKSADSVIRNQSLGAATSLVDYQSAGQCLLIAPVDIALPLVEFLSPLNVTILEIDPAIDPSAHRPVKRLTEDGVAVYTTGRPTITGHLGAFSVCVSEGDRTHDLAVLQMLETGSFDVILDTTSPALISTRLPPLGYRSVIDAEQLPQVAQELAELIGDFDKPRYFDYNVEICAHQRSRLPGCSKCVDICATDAIRSAGEGVEIDPYLCQGCGSCATVCPSGAMTYAYPRVSDAIQRTRDMRDQHGSSSILLLYRQTEEDTDIQFESTLPAHVLPVAVEEVTAFGIDYWAAMLAAGFNNVFVRVQVKSAAATTDAAVAQAAFSRDPDVLALQQQATMLHTVLQGLGLDDLQVVLVPEDEDLSTRLNEFDKPVREALPAFATHNNKRQTFRMAIDLLARHYEPVHDSVNLPAHSAFGQVAVNRDACTLCMACVSTCPAGALLDGQDLPKLRFIEANCVQCGLCTQACPENAIELQPLYSYDSVKAREATILNEEEPFNCVRCHKPFATRKMIDTMSAKLAGHWMFGDEKAVRRLKMCEDCRVMDIFEADAAGITVHRDD